MPELARVHEPFPLEKHVVTIYDETWIADHTDLYMNCFHRLTEEQIVEITDEIYFRSGFHVLVHTVTLDDLFGHRLPLPSYACRNFMCGRPIWRLPAMFVRGGKGRNRTSPVGQDLSEAMVIHAVFGKQATEELLKVEYSRGRHGWPRAEAPARAHQHAKEFAEHALGTRPRFDEDGNVYYEIVDVVERDQAGHILRETGAIRRYTWDSAQTIAREAIDRTAYRSPWRVCGEERIHIYKSALDRITDEARHSEQAFGVELNGRAIGAWYRRVVTALRLGASVFARLDEVRTTVAKDMLKANLTYQELRNLPNPTPASLRKMERLRAAIAQQAEAFDTRRDRALRRLDRNANVAADDDNNLACIKALDAAIIAFFGGVNARDAIPGVCTDLPPSFALLLDGLIWLGEFHRHRSWDLTFEAAYVLQKAFEIGFSDADHADIYLTCLDMGMSFIDPNDWNALIFTITEVATTCEAKTIKLRLKDVARPRRNARTKKNAAAAVNKKKASSKTSPLSTLRRPRDQNESETLYTLNPKLGLYQSELPELILTGTFLALPPFYQRDWAGRWTIERDHDRRFVDLIRAAR